MRVIRLAVRYCQFGQLWLVPLLTATPIDIVLSDFASHRSSKAGHSPELIKNINLLI